METESKKYNDILAAGRDLFWRFGFRRVTVEEICRRSGVSKMTFYKYFPDKTELAKRVFDMIVEEGEVQVRKIFKDDSPAHEKIKKLITMKMESTNNISDEFLRDFYSGSGELKSYVGERTRKSWDLLINDFREAQEAGTFRKDFRPELIIKIQSKIAELLEDSSVLAMYDTRQDLIHEFSKFMFYGVAPHD